MELEDIRAGDLVDIDDGIVGVVVFNSIGGDWSSNFPANEWPRDEYSGVMIQQENGALIFFPDEGFRDGTSCIKFLGAGDA